MRPVQLLFSGLFIAVALAQVPTKNADFLRGEGDIWSCRLHEQLNEACLSREDDEVTRRSLLARQSQDVPEHHPSACTCNNIYFNIWSACSLTNSNTHTLPLLREWEDACTEAGATYNNNLPLSSDNRLEGVRIPPWAQIPVLGDTFDVMQAVVVANPRDWKMVHILAPIFSCLGTLLLVGIVYFAVSRNRSKSSWFRKLHLLVPSLRPAQYEAPAKPDWVIDYNVDTQTRRQAGYVDVEASKTSFSLHDGDLHNDHNRKGPYQGQANNPKYGSKKNVLHKLKPSNASTNSLASTNRPPPLDLTDAFADPRRASPPLASKWSDSDSHRTAPPRIQNARRIPGSATLNSLVSHVRIPNPFGQRSAPLKQAPPDPRFQLDGGHPRPQLATSPKNYDTGFGDTIAGSGRGRRQPPRRQYPHEMEERESLITDEDRRTNSVFLISKAPGEDYIEDDQGARSDTMGSIPINSDIQVDSPTASSRESWKTKAQSQEHRSVQIPPAPRYPPPAPPSRSQSNSTYPLADIPEYIDKPHSSSSSSRNASQSQSPPSVGLIPPPFRGYAYTPDRYPTPDASPDALARHQQLPSIDSYFEVTEQGIPKKMTSLRQEEPRQLVREETPRQQPVQLQPSTSPPGRPNGPYIPNGYHHQQTVRQLPRLPSSPPRPRRTLSSSSSTSSNDARHWRRPSDEDPSSAFYFSPSSPPMHVRTLSQDTVHRR